MKLRVTCGLAVAALALTSVALGTRSFAAEFSQLSPPPAEAPDVTAPIQVAPGAKALAQIASAAGIATPPAETKAPAPIPPPARVSLSVPPLPSSVPPLPTNADKHHLTNIQIANLAGGVARPDRYRVASDGDARTIKVRARSEERRVGKECSSPCRSRWSPYH